MAGCERAPVTIGVQEGSPGAPLTCPRVPRLPLLCVLHLGRHLNAMSPGALSQSCARPLGEGEKKIRKFTYVSRMDGGAATAAARAAPQRQPEQTPAGAAPACRRRPRRQTNNYLER